MSNLTPEEGLGRLADVPVEEVPHTVEAEASVSAPPTQTQETVCDAPVSGEEIAPMSEATVSE